MWLLNGIEMEASIIGKYFKFASSYYCIKCALNVNDCVVLMPRLDADGLLIEW